MGRIKNEYRVNVSVLSQMLSRPEEEDTIDPPKCDTLIKTWILLFLVWERRSSSWVKQLKT